MPQKPRALTLVLNPNARKPRLKAPSLERLKKIVGQQARIHVTRNLGELDKLTRAWRHEDETVCFYGGDGSIACGITSLIRNQGEHFTLPPVLAVRAGTINMLCSILGFKEPANRTLVRWRHHELDTLRQVPTIKVEVEGRKPHYGFIFAWGVGYRILRDYYGRSPTPDVTDGAIVAFKALCNALLPNAMETPLFRARDLKLVLDGKTIACDPMRALTIGTIERVSLGIRPFAPGAVVPGGFHVSANAMSALRVAWHSPTLLYQLGDQRKLARRYSKKLVTANGVRELRCELSEGYTMDGEMFEIPEKARVHISPGPVVRFWTSGR